MLRQQVINPKVKHELFVDHSLQHLRNELQVRYRPVVARNCWIESRLFQYRSNFGYPERVRKVTATQWLVEKNSEQRCELISIFLDQPGRSRIEATGFIRRPSNQIRDVADGQHRKAVQLLCTGEWGEARSPWTRCCRSNICYLVAETFQEDVRIDAVLNRRCFLLPHDRWQRVPEFPCVPGAVRNESMPVYVLHLFVEFLAGAELFDPAFPVLITPCTAIYPLQTASFSLLCSTCIVKPGRDRPVVLVDDDAWSVTIDQGGECWVVDVSQLVDRSLRSSRRESRWNWIGGRSGRMRGQNVSTIL